jgi:hypothetical protein
MPRVTLRYAIEKLDKVIPEIILPEGIAYQLVNSFVVVTKEEP